jgi:hypothetical protein
MASSRARRRQRSTRLVVAVAMLAVAALVVVWSLAVDASWPKAVAAVAALLLGVAATRITHSELLATRREWARDRAAQAAAYLELDSRRTTEHREFVAHVTAEAGRRERALAELEIALLQAQARAGAAARKFSAEARRADLAEDENVRLGRQAEDAEQRAAEAIVHLAELEQEVEVLRAELAAWHALEAEQRRQHA